MAEVHSSLGKHAGGLSTSASLLVNIFVTHCEIIEKKNAWILVWFMGLIPRLQLFINSTDAIDMVVLAWEPPITGIVK